MKRSSQKRLVAGLTLAFLVLMFVAFLLLVSADQENKNSASVVHTRDVLDKVGELVSALDNAESGRRGYVVSSDARYWAQFTNQVQAAYQVLHELRALTLDNPPQTEACDRLSSVLPQRLGISTNSIQARQANGLDAAVQVNFMAQGQKSMEVIRQITSQMAQRETRLLKERLQLQDKNIKGTEGFAVLLGVCGLGLFTTFVVLFWKADARRRLAEEGLERSNLELEQRVKNRTAELLRSQEHVADERNTLRAVIDNLPVQIYLKDVEGRFLVNNLANVKALSAASEAETLGKTLYDFFPREAARPHAEDDKQVLAAGKSVLQREVRQTTGAGQQQWWLSTKVPLRDSQGVLTRLLGISEDITERKRSEEMRTRLAAIVEASDDAIFSRSLEGQITSWNPGAERLFGYSAQEAIAGLLPGFVPAEKSGEIASILERVARGQSIHRLETQRLRKNGTRLDISLTLSPVRDREGRVVGASEIARDITETKESERKLRTQLERLDLLSRTTRAIGERQDLGSIFQVVLQSLEDHLPIDFGCLCLYDPHASRLTIAHVGSKSHDLAHQLSMSEHGSMPIDENGLSRCVRGELVYEPNLTEVKFPFPQRLARIGLGCLVIAPLLVESQVFGVLIAARRQSDGFSSTDCEFLRQLSEHVALAAHQAELYTALQRAYEDLRKTQQTAAQQERLRALGQMASGIAHDINNALSPVSIYSEFLLEHEPNLSPRAREHLQTISAAIDDVSETVARMREFYRLREPQLVLAPVQLNALVGQVVNLTRAKWSDMPLQRGIVIDTRTELAKDLPAVLGVESEIREALTNLVLNSVDAMPNGGSLFLRTKVIDGMSSPLGVDIKSVSVEVSDTGLGMDEETQRRCLEPFFTTKGERGTGLGLAMVYGITRRHNAEVEIESAPGKGTTVRLVFPTSPTPDQEPSGRPNASSVPARLRILLVDDDPILLKSVGDVLEADGHVVVAANGGQAGIDAFSSRCGSAEAFDAVITDLGMPYLDGRKVASAIKGACSSTPVILLTGWGQRLLAQDGIPENVDRVLSKPPKIAELRAALAQCAPK